ncbi:Rnase Y domain-containing protein [Bittarella massiliensis (ex Durand et al. 2017)]|uniref:DUF4315 family protein n=1 Tax=Bittarella massiliensis (ex Durand et al. 2017) TaxID=1720313 RepID=A0AAW5KKH0_9FIRM|nr:hypothetical protein [Bittarella massiliensis (ex Durand et al. 2017)]
MEQKSDRLEKKLKDAEDRLAEAEAIKASQFETLVKISGLTAEQAMAQLLEKLDEELTHEKAL